MLHPNIWTGIGLYAVYYFVFFFFTISSAVTITHQERDSKQSIYAFILNNFCDQIHSNNNNNKTILDWRLLICIFFNHLIKANQICWMQNNSSSFEMEYRIFILPPFFLLHTIALYSFPQTFLSIIKYLFHRLSPCAFFRKSKLGLLKKNGNTIAMCIFYLSLIMWLMMTSNVSNFCLFSCV